MKEESVRSRQAKMQEEHEEAMREVDKWRERLGSKRKEVEFWMGKVDKSCIERIRAFQTPPILIGQIMEMSKSRTANDLFFFTSSSSNIDRSKTRREIRNQRTRTRQRSVNANRSVSTSSSILAGRLQAERLDRNQWKQYTSLMADSGRFVDMLHGVNWQDGLHLEVANGRSLFSIIYFISLFLSASGGILHCQGS